MRVTHFIAICSKCHKWKAIVCDLIQRSETTQGMLFETFSQTFFPHITMLKAADLSHEDRADNVVSEEPSFLHFTYINTKQLG